MEFRVCCTMVKMMQPNTMSISVPRIKDETSIPKARPWPQSMFSAERHAALQTTENRLFTLPSLLPFCLKCALRFKTLIIYPKKN